VSDGPLEPRHADLGIPGVTLTPTELVISAELTFDDWESVGFQLGLIRDMTTWALGDWVAVGETLFGERMAQGVEATGRKKATLLEYARVARRVARSRRRPNLSWTHHQVVASREPPEQDELLDRAEANRWTVEELRGMLSDPAYLDRRITGRPTVEVLELVHDVARAVLRAAEPLGGGFSRVPDDVLDRLRNALGPEAA
jgi:hypothetical protein